MLLCKGEVNNLNFHMYYYNCKIFEEDNFLEKTLCSEIVAKKQGCAMQNVVFRTQLCTA